MASGVVAQKRHIDAGGCGDFDGVADEPFFQIAGTHFRMALERERRATPAEDLMGADFSAGQQHSVLRQIQGIAVPMEHE